MFVVMLAGLQAVVELAEELVEQVPLGLVVPISGGAAGVVVATGARRRTQRSQRPDRPDGGQASVFDMPVQHNGFLAAGAGDRCGSGERFEPAGVGEAGAVVADLGQHPGTGELPQTGEAGDDLGVRVLLKMGDRRLGELVGSGAGRVELTQQRGEVDAHRVFDLLWLMQVGVGEDLAQPLDVAVATALAAGLDQQSAQPGRGQLRRLGWGRRGGQDGACAAPGQPAFRQFGERAKAAGSPRCGPTGVGVADLRPADQPRTPGTWRTRVITKGVDPQISCYYRSSRIKQYFKEHRALRTETVICNTRDFGIGRRVTAENWKALRAVGEKANQRLCDAQAADARPAPDVATFTQVTRPSQIDGQHAPGLPFGDPRVMAVLAAIVGFTHLLAGFDNPALVRAVTTLLGCPYTSRQATYDLRRLKRKGLIVRLPGHHRYQLTPLGRRVAVLFTKVYGRVLAPGLAELDPRLPTDLAHRSDLAHAWRQLDQRLNQFTNAALTAA